MTKLLWCTRSCSFCLAIAILYSIWKNSHLDILGEDLFAAFLFCSMCLSRVSQVCSQNKVMLLFCIVIRLDHRKSRFPNPWQMVFSPDLALWNKKKLSHLLHIGSVQWFINHGINFRRTIMLCCKYKEFKRVDTMCIYHSIFQVIGM